MTWSASPGWSPSIHPNLFLFLSIYKSRHIYMLLFCFFVALFVYCIICVCIPWNSFVKTDNCIRDRRDVYLWMYELCGTNKKQKTRTDGFRVDQMLHTWKMRVICGENIQSLDREGGMLQWCRLLMTIMFGSLKMSFVPFGNHRCNSSKQRPYWRCTHAAVCFSW